MQHFIRHRFFTHPLYITNSTNYYHGMWFLHEVLLTRIGVTYGSDNHRDIRSNDCFVVFHFLKLFSVDFEQLVASVKSALTKLYGKPFCESHFKHGCVIDGSCSNLVFSSDDIRESQMPNLVSYSDANGKDPVANLLMKASGWPKATIISFDIKERDAFETIPRSRRPDSSASASASPARPAQLRYVVIPSIGILCASKNVDERV